jgi:hypothetical protein
VCCTPSINLYVRLQEDYVPEGEVVLTVENKSPLHDTFQFQRITGGLTRCVPRYLHIHGVCLNRCPLRCCVARWPSRLLLCTIKERSSSSCRLNQHALPGLRSVDRLLLPAVQTPA